MSFINKILIYSFHFIVFSFYFHFQGLLFYILSITISIHILFNWKPTVAKPLSATNIPIRNIRAEDSIRVDRLRKGGGAMPLRELPPGPNRGNKPLPVPRRLQQLQQQQQPASAADPSSSNDNAPGQDHIKSNLGTWQLKMMYSTLLHAYCSLRESYP